MFALLVASIQSSAGLDWAVVLPLCIPHIHRFLNTVLTVVLQVPFCPSSVQAVTDCVQGSVEAVPLAAANVRGLSEIEDHHWKCFVSLSDKKLEGAYDHLVRCPEC